MRNDWGRSSTLVASTRALLDENDCLKFSYAVVSFSKNTCLTPWVPLMCASSALVCAGVIALPLQAGMAVPFLHRKTDTSTLSSQKFFISPT